MRKRWLPLHIKSKSMFTIMNITYHCTNCTQFIHQRNTSNQNSYLLISMKRITITKNVKLSIIGMRHGCLYVTSAVMLPSLRWLALTRYKLATSAESTISKTVCYHTTALFTRIAMNNFATRYLVLQSSCSFTFFFLFGNGFHITSLVSFGRDMSEVILNFVKKNTQRSKSLCSTRC